MIDAMAINKMNVLHWHITDDESFPFHSKQFPNLSKGAFHPSMVYKESDVRDIVDHARIRGIRVIPEFDMPYHVPSWGIGHPEMLIKCRNYLGTLNPTANSTFAFLLKLYQEVFSYFPDRSLHIGGDEMDSVCWTINFVKGYHSMNVRDIREKLKFLYKKFMENLIDLLPSENQVFVWEEVFGAQVNLSENIVVQVWKNGWINKMHQILNAGGRIIFSSEWYLDYLDRSWETYYSKDPRHLMSKKRRDKLKDIIGGEACMWGEKDMAPCERYRRTFLWSGVDNYTVGDPVTGLVRRHREEHTCRMRRRGIPAEPPNGPGFCVVI